MMQTSTALKKNFFAIPSGRRLLRSLLVIYVLFVVGLYLGGEDALVFLPQPASYTAAPGFLSLTCTDGKHIAAVYVPHPGATYTVLYSHGNAEDIGENLSVAGHIADLGYNVLLYDYHGYGLSEGRPGERNSGLDIDAAYAYLRNVKHVAPKHLVLYGRSVGGGPTLDLASRQPIGALVLESTFTDPASVRVPIRILPWVMFPSLERIGRVHVPTLVMHGLADDLIPVAHGQALYAAAPGPKFALWVPGAHHNDFKDVAGIQYDTALLKFRHYLETHG